ncbi:MAG: hypothetical protein RID53_25010 [Coleofasciculus sp. B1-GNL1-01]
MGVFVVGVDNIKDTSHVMGWKGRSLLGLSDLEERSLYISELS